ncbi:peptidylprolyl isomerase [Rhodopirellula baltica]|uniref:peptidylprolyl isomerase n=1 Tax=Rhodopirellula baltica WH47 TaxID=991778 RepID=F2AQ58_RHOBT|nr:peptidylprolyl isomerase [Rhodopirellula baltica]EGF28194.1 PpiC-type peptidyl-prolyl cis-trans isomerase [Rhodopirellula baltica WH47]
MTNQSRMALRQSPPQNITRRHLLLAAAFVAILSGFSTMRVEAAENSVVAVVNADPISRDSLATASVQRYGTDVLDNLINRHLIMQECKRRGLGVTTEEVRTEINRVAKKFGLNVESYLQLLNEERDITPDQYSREIIWPMLALRKLVADEVAVSQDEFNRAIVSQFGEAIKCRMVMVQDKSQATQLRAQAVAEPSSFARLAKEFSEDPTSASVGGLIPPIRRYMGDETIEEAAFALKVDEVSELLPVGDHWMFLQAVRRMPASTPSPQAMPAIKDQIEDRIRDEKMKTAASQLFAQLQEQAQVVKILGDPQASAKHPGVAAIINGQQVSISNVAAECIKRHGESVLEGEINRKLLTQALAKAGKKVTNEDLKAEIERAAISFGYMTDNGSADVQGWFDAVLEGGPGTREVYIEDVVWPSVALKKLVEDKTVLTQEDLQIGFESHYGPRAEVLACVLSDQRSAQKVWEMARDNPTDQFFGQLANQYSIEPVSSSNFGKVPPIKRHGGQPSVEKEVFQMKPGDLSGIIATGDKYIILRCQGFTEPVVSDFEAVQEELRSVLIEKKMNVAMSLKYDELKQTAEIDNFFVASKEIPRVASGTR